MIENMESRSITSIKMLTTDDDLSDEEACGDEGPSLQRLRGKGRNQRQELHRLQGEGSQDTNHPGLDDKKKKIGEK